jgi:hypothetical protein
MGDREWRRYLCHDCILVNSINTSLFNSLCKTNQFLIPIQFAPMFQSPRPSENRRNRIRRSLPPLLMFPIMSRDGPVRGLRLDRLAIRGDQHRRHETEGTVALGNDIGLNVAVVIFTGPDESTARFEGLGYHVVDETVLVPDSFGFELGFVFSIRRG